MAVMSAAQTAAELQRKKNLGIAPTSSANQAQYNAIKPQTPAVTGVSAASAAAKPASPVSTPQMNAATGGSSPSLGYGGTTYGSSGAANQAIAANQSALNNQAGFKDSEIARTQSVIEQRKAQGLDTSAQEKYLTANLGYSAQAAQPSRVSYPQMQGDPMTSPRSYDQLQGVADAQIDQERAALQNSLKTLTESAKNNANYSNQLTKDNRVLEDQALLRNSNPFSGGTGYQLAQVQRGRSIDDTARATQLDTQLNSYAQEIANYDKLTPQRKLELSNELLQMERQFGLNVGQLTGEFGGKSTLQKQALDWQKQVDEAGLTGNFNGQKTASQTQQEWENRFNYGNAIGQFGNGQKTLESKKLDRANFESDRQYNFAVGQQEWDNNFQTGQFNWQKAQQAWENTFQEKNFEQSMKEAAASRGLQWANLAQNQKEFIANQSFKEKEFTYKQEQDKISNELAASKASSSSTSQKYSYKSDPDFMSDAANMVKNPTEARAALRDNSQAFIDKYGIEGYNYLISTVSK